MPLLFMAVLLFAGTSVVLMLWISRFRQRAEWGAPGRNQGLGSRSPAMTWMDLLDRDSYSPDGQRLLPWLRLSFFLLLVAIGGALAQQFWHRVGR